MATKRTTGQTNRSHKLAEHFATLQLGSPSITERFRDVWNFLSIELAVPFRRELWVPVSDAEFLQKTVRERLLEAAHDEVPAARLHVDLVTWFQGHYGSEAWNYLLLWAQNILTYRGPDRVDEFVWRMRLMDMEQSQSFNSIPGHLREAVVSVLNRYRQTVEAFETKLDGIKSNPAALQQFENEADLEVFEISLRNSVNSNVFISSWQEFFPHEMERSYLDQLYTLVLRASRNMKIEREIAYPGAWLIETYSCFKQFGAT